MLLRKLPTGFVLEDAWREPIGAVLLRDHVQGRFKVVLNVVPTRVQLLLEEGQRFLRSVPSRDDVQRNVLSMQELDNRKHNWIHLTFFVFVGMVNNKGVVHVKHRTPWMVLIGGGAYLFL